MNKKEALDIRYEMVSGYPNYQSKFIIKTENGDTYEFADMENSRSGSDSYTSAWYLSSITSLRGNKITFEYEVVPRNTPMEFRSFSHYVLDVWNTSNSISYISGSGGYPVDVNGGTHIDEVKLKKIKSSNGWIEFINGATTRKDSRATGDYPLAAILIYQSAGQLLKKYQLYTGYFEAERKYTGNNESMFRFLNYRLRLDSLKEFSGDLQQSQTYRFSYNDGGVYSLPYRFSPEQDHWGYYNSSHNAHIFPDNRKNWRNGFAIDPVFSFFYPKPDMVDNPIREITGGANREPDIEAMKAGTLSKIEYPTGGSTRFYFEPNKFSWPEAGIGAGLRIRQTIDYPNDKEPATTLYFYDDGSLNYHPTDYYFNYYMVNFDHNTGYPDIPPRILSLFGLPFERLSREAYYVKISAMPQAVLGNNSNVSYQHIKVSQQGNGYTDYYYASTASYADYTTNEGTLWPGSTDEEYQQLHKDFYVQALCPWAVSPLPSFGDVVNYPNGVFKEKITSFAGFPYLPTYSNEWKRGVLEKKETYSENGILQQKEEYTYYRKLLKALRGFKVYKIEDFPTYIYGQYSLPCAQMYLERQTLTQYDEKGQNPLAVVSEYFYDNPDHSQLTREITTKSDGAKETKVITYPIDYPAGTTSLDEMKANHLVNAPVERVTYIERGGNKSILSGTILNYKSGGKGLIESELRTEMAAPVPVNSFKFSNLLFGVAPPSDSKIVLSPDNTYQLQASYEYNNRGRLVQYDKRGDKTSYLWGYNGQYPVAKITGSDLSTVLATIDTTRLSTPVSDESLRGILSPLRNISNALVSTYTYAPLIGMTSETDPTGKTIYYEYDHFGRLSTIKDENEKALKQLKYNYYQQQDGEQTNTYYSRSISQSFARNNCPAGSTGSLITYTIPAGKYTSSLNQETADNLALADMTTNGQAYANANGTCSVAGFINDDQSGIYANNVCGIDLNTEQLLGSPYYISVPAGMFSSEISKEDANRKAKTYAQQMVDNNGSCPGSNFCRLVLNFSDHPNYYPHKFDVSILDNNTGTYIKFPMTDFGKVFNDKLIALIPAGWYSLYIESNMLYVDGNVFPGYDFTFDIFGNAQFGNAAWYDQIHFYEGDTVNLSVY